MLSLVPKNAPWNFARNTGAKVVKVFEKAGFRSSLLGLVV